MRALTAKPIARIFPPYSDTSSRVLPFGGIALTGKVKKGTFALAYHLSRGAVDAAIWIQ
jgi:hypothetical protein